MSDKISHRQKAGAARRAKPRNWIAKDAMTRGAAGSGPHKDKRNRRGNERVDYRDMMEEDLDYEKPRRPGSDW